MGKSHRRPIPKIAPARRRLIRRPVVEDRTGLSKTSIWRGGQQGTFPKPVKSSPGCVAWLEDEVDAWIASRVAARDSTDRENPVITSQPARKGRAEHRR
jgi:prophage regulatory protein